LLVALIGKADEPVATRHARKRVGHDLCRLAGWETALEERYKDVLVDFWTKVTHEDGVLWTTVVASISQTTTGGPVELERAVGVWHWLSTELKSLASGLRGGKIDEAIARVTANMSSETKK
jgi:hypothetical protein